MIEKHPIDSGCG